MMRKQVIFFLMIFAAMFSAGKAEAFTQNEFTTAASLDPGMTQTGIFFTIGDLEDTDYRSFYPFIRYGLGALFEVGVKFGVTSLDVGPDDKLGALVGADIKYQLIKETGDIPLDLAVDVGLDTTFISGDNVSELTFSTIISKGFPLMDRGYKFTPYGGIELSSMHGSSQYVPPDDTKVFGIGGLEWKISQKFMFLAEVKFGAEMIGGIGINFEY